MKGTIHFCLEETVQLNYGKPAWKHCLQAMGKSPDFTYASKLLQDVDEEESISLFFKSAEVLKIPLKQLFDEFGEHWCCMYAPKLYPQFFKNVSSTKELLMGLDQVHQQVTNKKPGTIPPRFYYEWQLDKRLKVTYDSKRGLFELFESLLRGLDLHFKNNTQIERQGETSLLLKFD